MVAHRVINVLSERCAPMFKEPITHRTDALSYITSTTQCAPHLINDIVPSTPTAETRGAGDTPPTAYRAFGAAKICADKLLLEATPADPRQFTRDPALLDSRFYFPAAFVTNKW